MRVIWGTRTRGGSQFLLELTVALLDMETVPQSRINAGRREAITIPRSPSLDDFAKQRRPLEYFRYHRIAALKLEEPGMDNWGRRLAATYPRTPWLGNHRSIEKILRSHHNLAWGFGEQKLLRRARRTLEFYEQMAEAGRLFVLNIDTPESFDLASFADFLGAEVTPAAVEMAANWPRLNALAELRAEAGLPLTEVEEPPRLDTLRRRHPWIDDMEARFERLCAIPNR